MYLTVINNKGPSVVTTDIMHRKITTLLTKVNK